MRKYDFDEYRKKNLPAFHIMRAKISCNKTFRKKPRPEEEWKAFFLLTKKRREKWLKNGLLEKTGERRYRLKI
jgi:hypothetical protein